MLFFIPFRRIGSERPQSPTDFSSKSIGLGGEAVRGAYGKIGSFLRRGLSAPVHGGFDAAAPARAADVVSSNVVGYKKLTLTGNNYNMISPMFVNVGGEPKAIKDIFSDNTVFQAADNSGEADYISVWENGGYNGSYFYSSDAADETEDAKWASEDDSFAETKDELPENCGFWLYRRGAQTEAVLAGEVATDDTTIKLAAYTYTMVANPFAADLPIKTILPATTTDVIPSADNSGEADYISIWRNGGYSASYFYSSDAGDEDADAKWASEEDSFSETEDSIAPGEAFWIFHRGPSITIKLSAPYTLN